MHFIDSVEEIATTISNHVKLTLIHTYAPTNDTDEEVKDHFYEKLQAIVEKTPKNDLLVITGDLNAKEAMQKDMKE